METEHLSASAYACPSCGGPLEPGYILGKQSRLRWAASPKGFTVFKGMPLSSLPKHFWFSREGWTQAPSVRAARCARCGLGVFEHDADPRPLRSGKRAALFAALAVVCSMASMFVLTSSLFVGLENGSELAFFALLGAFMLLGLAAVGLFVRLFVETV